MRRKKDLLVLTLCLLLFVLASCDRKTTKEEVKGASTVGNTIFEEPEITEDENSYTEETKGKEELDNESGKTEVVPDSSMNDSTAIETNEITEAYKYPIVPDTEEWKKLKSMPEKIEATHVDPDLLHKMSTRALVETVVKYPLFDSVHAYDTLAIGIKEVSEYFKGIEELESRDDAREEILKYINDRCPGLAEMRTEDEISAALSKYMDAYTETGDREVFYIDNAVTLINYMDGNYRGGPNFKGYSQS